MTSTKFVISAFTLYVEAVSTFRYISLTLKLVTAVYIEMLTEFQYTSWVNSKSQNYAKENMTLSLNMG
jgi:hypothetical protein